MSDYGHTIIGLSRTVKIPAGTMLLALWDLSVPVTTIGSFRVSLGGLGEVWDLNPYPVGHVGITLAREISELDGQVAIAKANGGQAARVFSIRGFETYVQLQQLGESGKRAVIDSIEATIETLGTAANSALWFAKWAPWIIGGLLVLGAVAVIAVAVKKVKK